MSPGPTHRRPERCDGSPWARRVRTSHSWGSTPRGRCAERRSVSLAIPEGTEGQIELALEAPRDALALDNRAWLDVGRRAALPVVVRARAPEGRSTLAGWLGGCPGPARPGGT